MRIHISNNYTFGDRLSTILRAYYQKYCVWITIRIMDGWILGFHRFFSILTSILLCTQQKFLLYMLPLRDDDKRIWQRLPTQKQKKPDFSGFPRCSSLSPRHQRNALDVGRAVGIDVFAFFFTLSVQGNTSKEIPRSREHVHLSDLECTG